MSRAARVAGRAIFAAAMLLMVGVAAAQTPDAPTPVAAAPTTTVPPMPDVAPPPADKAQIVFLNVESMLRHGTPTARALRQYDWDVYLRREGDRFREAFAACEAAGIVTRRLERMAYGLAEFEIRDPDGYILCLGQDLGDADDLPSPSA